MGNGELGEVQRLDLQENPHFVARVENAECETKCSQSNENYNIFIYIYLMIYL